MTAPAARPFPELPATIHKIHIIGICGTAMGSLAAMLKELGFDVRGSDAGAYPPMSDWLADRQIDIMPGYDAANLNWNPDLVIVGNVCRSIYADAVEMRRRAIPYLSLPEALRHFFMTDKRSLVITGTHGKTTTSSMLAWILTHAGHDPGFMIGGITGNFDSNYQIGNGDSFVIEGDEYDTAYFDKVPKFWHYNPFRATINNLEFDHADIYPDLAAIESVFKKFVSMIPANGSLWINGDDEKVVKVSSHCPGTLRTFGLGEQNNLRATDIAYGDYITANLWLDAQSLGEFALPGIGEFNLRNMMGATAIAIDEGIAVDTIREALIKFIPTKKRQETIGVVNDITVIDDFAHHPSAVYATLNALRKRYPSQRLWALFEAKSNTSRRRIFQDQYPDAFALADHVILSKPWRKDDDLPPEKLLDINELAQSIRALGPTTDLIPEIDDIADFVAAKAQPGDIIAGLSGASFGGVHHKIIDRLKKRFDE